MQECVQQVASWRKDLTAYRQYVAQEETVWSHRYDELQANYHHAEARVQEVEHVLPEEYQQSQQLVQQECELLQAAIVDGKPVPEQFQQFQHVAARQ